MNTVSLSIKSILTESWKITIKHIWLFAASFLAFLLLYLLINALSGGFNQPIDPNLPPLEQLKITLGRMVELKAVIGWLATNLLLSFFTLGACRMAIRAVDGEESILAHFASSPRKILHFFLSNLIFNIVFLIGAALCIIPGFILAARLQLFGYFIVEEDCNAMEALSRSWECTKGKTWKLTWFLFLICILIFLSCIAFFVGSLIVVPMCIVAYAVIYRKLAVGKENKEVDFETLETI